MSYETTLQKLAALTPSHSEEERHVTWVGTTATVGASRTFDGRIEIFLAGAPISSIYPRLNNSLVRGMWYRSVGKRALEATRLLLPTAGHFTQVAAFICTELLRNGADNDLIAAFQKSEPLINYAVEGLSMNAEVTVGLKGELVLLQGLLQGRGSRDIIQVVDSWHGWRRSTRDFALGSTGVEVKTTTGASSSHEMQGLHQVEVSVQPDGEMELLLVSIGIENAMPDNDSAYTLPRIVDAILEQVRQSLQPADAGKLRASLLGHIRDYGSDQGMSYDHATMSEDPSFSQPFVLRWVRGYNMADDAVKVLRSATIAPLVHVDANTVRFSIQLPTQVSGDANPVSGLAAVASTIMNSPAEPG